ncbi:MAG: hypothetical protein JOY82_03700 [Streptosporangiaceae bacterium]|nr:hypothetical protein [Streptosporangiaceae bacterium]MBV9853617.1 hypothetical protein [Streptosporangiaceae bacterium]
MPASRQGPAAAGRSKARSARPLAATGRPASVRGLVPGCAMLCGTATANHSGNPVRRGTYKTGVPYR